MAEQLTAKPARKRWFRADNVRYLLLFNVIAEHTLTQTGITCTGILELFVVWSRLVTMPTFCFLSGYFSKNTDKRYRTAIGDFLIPYIIFDGIFFLIYGGTYTDNIFTPVFLYWYMLSMFCWNIMARGLEKIRGIVPISIVVALLVGLLPDVSRFLSLSRTIVFLPYFMFGLLLSREGMAKIENLNRWVVTAATIVVVAIVGWAELSGVYDIDFFYDWDSYSAYGYSAVKGILLRLAGYGVSGLFIVAMFVTVPDRHMPLASEGGTRTMMPYLLHAYVIFFLKIFVVPYVPAMDHWYVMLPLAFGLAVLLLWLLGLPAFNDLYNDFVGGIKKLLFKPDEEPKKV